MISLGTVFQLSVPTHGEMVDDVLDRHVLSQVQNVAGQVLGVAATGLGKADLDLPDHLALAALDAGQVHND
jgi:hypothetical protein